MSLMDLEVDVVCLWHLLGRGGPQVTDLEMAGEPAR